MIEKFIEGELRYFQSIISHQESVTEEMRNAWRNETVAQRLERISLKTYDLCNGIVLQGLFKDLKLNRDTWWGKCDLGAQCLGLYEKEVQDLIEAEGPFKVFLDVGAADGYYATGVLHAKMAEKAICFEISEQGRLAIKENWVTNGSPGELVVYGEATPQSIIKVAATLPLNSFVLIDIEGFEFSLLTPEVLFALKECTVIIEIHNWIEDFLNRYSSLLRDLDAYFHVDIIKPIDRDTHKIQLLQSYSDDNRLLVTSERRPCLMRFLHLKPRGINAS